MIFVVAAPSIKGVVLGAGAEGIANTRYSLVY